MLPPREPPQQVVPPVQLPPYPVPAGHARVMLDSTDGPMRVSARFDHTFVPPGRAVVQGKSGELCMTPCVVDLPVGGYRLYLSAAHGTDPSRGDSDDLVLDEGVFVYRRAPGRYDTPTPTDQVLPVVAVVLSAGLIVAGSLALSADAMEGRSSSAGIALLGLGIGGTIGSGWWLYDSSRATRQEGASSIWRVDR